MNEKQLADIWNAVLNAIQTEVSSGTFITLFKNTALISIENDVAIITAPSTMVIDLIRKRFLKKIKEILEKHAKKTIEITFISKGITKQTSQEANNGPLFTESPKNTKLLSMTLPRVRTDYVFETMAVSSSNQLAFVSATTVAKNPGKFYNPFFIYGPVGVGKTHLMHAIANEVYKNDPQRKIIYKTSEEFTNEVVEAIRTNDTQTMKKRFRSAHLLIIDDVQFLAGKDRVQEELFHTFNILIDNSAQVVLSSDRPPQEIKKLERRLSSRFAGGLTVDIEVPDFELRTAILLIKAKKIGVDLPIDAAKIIAQDTQDTRQLEGALLRVITESSTQNTNITDILAKKALLRNTTKHAGLHAEDVVRNVCSFYDIKSTQIKGPKRNASLVHARQICMYILKNELGLTLVEIGNILGGRDHTTVIYGVEKIEDMLITKPKFQEELRGITRLLRE